MKVLTLLFLAFLIVGCKYDPTPTRTEKSGAPIKAASATQGQDPVAVTKAFLVWYRDHMTQLNQIETIRGGIDPNGVPDEGNYHVDFKAVDQYIQLLRSSGCLSERLLQRERKTFEEGEKHFAAEPANDGPPYGFEYDHFFMTQEAFEDDLADVDAIDFTVLPMGEGHAHVTFYLPLADIRYAYYVRRIDAVWMIDTITRVDR
ncbi:MULTISPECIES: hypothetical protein [unclassified Flavobacterium]|uniref:hypothetical protein n=1 Tax=unclassified Flavobacterium TaxID=196869 RepID=UPI001F141A87|nr:MULTISPECIES: hypothetical protein [unclassified Flavobacterium]UMY64351.1 hypothetical protein MKO97_07470 [Flavobacterium sp. HJ-32-4]